MKNNKFKGAVSLLLVVAMMFAIVFGVRAVDISSNTGAVSLASATDGTYTASSKGYGGDITVTLTIAGGKITELTADGPKETPTVGGVACSDLPAKMLEEQSCDVDAMSGATFSSNAIKEAAKACLEQAGATVTEGKKKTKKVKKTKETKEVDVVVVGGGGAGMAAAITAQQEGKTVLLVEKMSVLGGNTSLASGGMNAAGTKYQKEAAEKETDSEKKAAIIDSTVKNYIADTMSGGQAIDLSTGEKDGKDVNDKSLVSNMAKKSSDAIDWLASIGAELPLLAATGGTTHYYLHEPADGSAVGGFLVEKFSNKLEELNIEVLKNTEATSIIMKKGAASGIKASSDSINYTINAKAVVIATGGFGANMEMVAENDSKLEGTVTTNAAGATGDGIKMAQKVGADTVDMERIQLHPTVYQETGALVSERVRSNGAILVNSSGKRFVNDLATRDVVSQAELKEDGKYAYIVYDSRFTDEVLYKKYSDQGLAVSADTLEGLAEKMGYDKTATKNFVKTVEKWNTAVKNKGGDEFGRDNGFESCDQAPYYAIKIAPGIHHTMGGLKINTKTEVLNTKGNVIKGLYAAGEVTGGVHGANRIGGNAIADIVVYGRTAGQQASKYASK